MLIDNKAVNSQACQRRSVNLTLLQAVQALAAAKEMSDNHFFAEQELCNGRLNDRVVDKQRRTGEPRHWRVADPAARPPSGLLAPPRPPRCCIRPCFL